MVEPRNILWTKLCGENAERIRKALNVPNIERGSQAWRAKIIAAALRDWAGELDNGQFLDPATANAFGELYAMEVYVKKPWSADKRPVLNVNFRDQMVTDIDTIGRELERLRMPNVRGRNGYNSAAVVMLALDKYAKKLELLKGMNTTE